MSVWRSNTRLGGMTEGHLASMTRAPIAMTRARVACVLAPRKQISEDQGTTAGAVGAETFEAPSKGVHPDGFNGPIQLPLGILLVFP